MSAVVDASFAGAWLLPDESTSAADQVLEAVLSHREEIVVPQLWEYEMANLLISAHRRGRITQEQIFEAQDLIAAVPRTTYDHKDLLTQNRLARLALRFSLSGYDAAYLELADRLQYPLHTNDSALSAAATAIGLSAGKDPSR